MEFLCLGIVKKNEKEIFIAVLLKNLNFFIYGEFYAKNYKTIFLAQLQVSICPEMLLMELSISQRSGHVFSCSTLNSVMLMLEQIKHINNYVTWQTLI